MKYLLSIVLLLLLTGCADHATFSQAQQMSPVGFWFGLWHGFIAPISWVISLFSESVSIYAIYNNGGWYDFGFIWGIGGLTKTISCSTKTTKRGIY